MRSSRPGRAKLGTVELVGEAFVGVWNEVPSMDDLLIKFIIKFRTLIAGIKGVRSTCGWKSLPKFRTARSDRAHSHLSNELLSGGKS